jgi:acetolactate decarboxylase
MKKVYLMFAVTLLIITICASGCISSPKDREALFQSSTISALSEGSFDGDLTYKDLRQHGDFGLGTFDDLDGEMIALAGEFYQIKADGRAYLAEDSMETPFAVVTFFEPDKTVSLDRSLDYEQLKQYLDSMLPDRDIFYAIKVEGTFEYIKARSVAAQSKPYPPLAEALEGQIIFEFHDITGSLVGFWCPIYVEGINVPGYHLHFITGDRKAGGHLLDCQTESIEIEVDYTPRFFMLLPRDAES